MIGVFGGTFDPIHYAHLRVALDVVESLNLEALHFVPLKTPVHRAKPVADTEQRLAMLRAAIGDESRFVADDRELRRPGSSYSVETLRSFRETFGDRSICLVMGSDAFNGFLGWRDPERIVELAHLVVMQRPGYHLPEDPQLQRLVELRRSDLASDLRDNPSGRIMFLPVTQLDISSTDIRQRLAAGHSARYLSPDAVLDIAAATGCYLG